MAYTRRPGARMGLTSLTLPASTLPRSSTKRSWYAAIALQLDPVRLKTGGAPLERRIRLGVELDDVVSQRVARPSA